jgi:putative ABC transport system ATP-binding protein
MGRTHPSAPGVTHMNGKAIVELRSISKTYGSSDNQVAALTNVTLDFLHGTFTAVMGPSGSGKSTLLHCAGGLACVDVGEVVVAGTVLNGLGENELTRLRRERIGFVFQFFNLVPSLTVWQNVELPIRLAGRRAPQAEVTAVLASLGLTDRVRHRPDQLSGGQQQRVAIARAMVTRPKVLFADEPTGALDSRASRDVLGLLRDMAERSEQTVIMVTHDPTAAAYAGRVVFLGDGRVVSELVDPTSEAVAAHLTRLEQAPC